jgi:hypothetical protein
MGARNAMKRDMELVRALLLQIEAVPRKTTWKDLTPTDDEAEAERVLDHLRLMTEAGLIKCSVQPVRGCALPYEIEITWKGYEFLDDIRDPEVWGKTKERAKAVAGIGLNFLWEIAKVEIKAKLGLP